MIESLTPQQEKDLQVHLEAWFTHASCTNPADRPRVEGAVRAAHEVIGRPCHRIVWVDSPAAALYLAILLQPSDGDDIDAQLKKIHKVGGQITNVVQKFGTKERELFRSLSSEFWCWGSQEYWIALHRFCQKIGIKYAPEDARKLDIWEDLTHGGWVISFEKLSICVERPVEIYWTKAPLQDRRLHRDGGAALLYRDGWAVYSLNGVLVPDWLALTPEGQIDPKRLTEISNVEIRREFLRKVGIERVLAAFESKVIDSAAFENDSGHHEYELLELKVPGTNNKWRYLKMSNPSVHGIYHVEGVANQCKTVREALLFRNGLRPEQIDDEAGADWYQQGDVTLMPAKATRFKLFPKILT